MATLTARGLHPIAQVNAHMELDGVKQFHMAFALRSDGRILERWRAIKNEQIGTGYSIRAKLAPKVPKTRETLVKVIEKWGYKIDE